MQIYCRALIPNFRPEETGSVSTLVLEGLVQLILLSWAMGGLPVSFTVLLQKTYSEAMTGKFCAVEGASDHW